LRTKVQEEKTMSSKYQSRYDRRTLFKGAAGLGLTSGLGGWASRQPAVAQDAASLEFWDMVWGPPEYIDTNDGLISQFNEANPAIQVEYR
jgi:ABC-type glycerol-3-phosphate transport system substrate-binding protein